MLWRRRARGIRTRKIAETAFIQVAKVVRLPQSPVVKPVVSRAAVGEEVGRFLARPISADPSKFCAATELRTAAGSGGLAVVTCSTDLE